MTGLWAEYVYKLDPQILLKTRYYLYLRQGLRHEYLDPKYIKLLAKYITLT